jgi:hypothetical protein
MTTVHYQMSGFMVLALATMASTQSVGSAQSTTTKRPAIGRVLDVLGEPIPAAEVQVIVAGQVVQPPRVRNNRTPDRTRQEHRPPHQTS